MLVALSVGVIVGYIVYYSAPSSECPQPPYSWLHVQRCGGGYTLYSSDILPSSAFSRVLSGNALAAYVVSSRYSSNVVRIPGVHVSGPAYAVVLPHDSNSATLFAFWSNGSRAYAASVPVVPDRSMVDAVPAHVDLNLCHAVLTEVNMPIKYFRAYLESDHNELLEHCTYYLDVDFNTASSALSRVFKAVLEISGNVTYEIPDLNAAATLYSKPEVVLDVYRAEKAAR
ncbi:MAG: hypothetical protein GXN93_01835 [Candidatus Diapherotrites archaeon]|nr:hypothetical protein [Candidatus Diapherotrites archaeon]